MGGDPPHQKDSGGFPPQGGPYDDGIWDYLYLEEEMWEAGLEEAEVYISWKKNMAEQYIATRLIL